MAELDKLAKEYISARDEFESTRQVFEAAREKLVAVRKVAPEVMGNEWHAWTRKHPEVRLVGLETGEAIVAVLQNHAYAAASARITSLGKTPDEQKAYDPFLTPQQILDSLDNQGFEFKTAAPRREIHAALLNLKGIVKNPDASWVEYAVEDHEEVHRSMREVYGLPRDEDQDAPGGEDGPSLFAETTADNDVPF